MLNGCHALVLECNHDSACWKRDYPYSLSSAWAASGALEQPVQRYFRAAGGELSATSVPHLSRKNNTAELAVQA